MMVVGAFFGLVGGNNNVAKLQIFLFIFLLFYYINILVCIRQKLIVSKIT